MRSDWVYNIRPSMTLVIIFTFHHSMASQHAGSIKSSFVLVSLPAAPFYTWNFIWTDDKRF